MAKSENKQAQSDQGAAIAEKPKRAAQGPRPAYLGYRIVDAEGNDLEGASLRITCVARKADDILSHVTETGDLWSRFVIK